MSSAWTAEQVRIMHTYYISHPEMTVQQVADHFGVSMNYMYQLFERDLLGKGREDQAAPAQWMRLSREQVEEMYARYLEAKVSTDNLAEKHGLSSVEMYQAFKRFDLPAVRADRRAAARDANAPAERCPAMRLHEFCPLCPCPAPRCIEGHGPHDDEEQTEQPQHAGGLAAESQDWRCGTCKMKTYKCACWHPGMRELCGFSEAYAEWEKWRQVEREKAARLRKQMRSRRRQLCPQ